MPDALAQALALPGLGWLAAVSFLAGLVRGFSGFGTALIFMPMAAQVLPPLWALIALVLMDVFGPVPNIPAALRRTDRGDLLRLLAGTLLILPLGLWLLERMAPELFRTGVSLLALGVLVCLIAGLRYRGRLGPGLVLGTGGIAGFLGGVAGLPGPPVILMYMASPNPAPVVRASIMTYLFCYDFLLLAILALKSALAAVPVLIGLVLALPNIAGNLTGALLFRPSLERFYRGGAYVIIAASALSGLSVWG